MPERSRKLLIFGDSAIAEVAYEYFTYDSGFDVVAFTVDREFRKRESLFGLPVVPFEEVEQDFPPAAYSAFAAVGYAELNRFRQRTVQRMKLKGYELASYVSTRANVWRNVEIGENCFILEGNVIQPFVRIGNNVTLWCGNHVGHHSTVEDHCFVSSHVVISGFVRIGEYSFVGVNATIGNNVTVARNTTVGAGALILQDTGDAAMYAPKSTDERGISSLRYWRVHEGS